MRIGKDGTVVIAKTLEENKSKNKKPAKPKMANLDQTEPLEFTTEAIGGFLNAVKFRRISSKTHEEYQAWVEGLDPLRKGMLSCYEIGYIHGTKDEQLKNGSLKLNPRRAD